MKYFYDTEFIEGTQKKLFGKTKPTIDLISIGIVCEDDREYYAISKDFNLKEAWNRYDLKTEICSGDMRNIFPNGRKYKDFWIRENILRPIWNSFVSDYNGRIVRLGLPIQLININNFTYKNFKSYLDLFGKKNKQIASEIKEFIYEKEDKLYNKQEIDFDAVGDIMSKIELYGYYSAYDHVVFSWLFGKMIDLPKGFPMYTIDLKQMLDEKYILQVNKYPNKTRLEAWNQDVKKYKNYPKQHEEHIAIYDARWNFEFYNFLKSI